LSTIITLIVGPNEIANVKPAHFLPNVNDLTGHVTTNDKREWHVRLKLTAPNIGINTVDGHGDDLYHDILFANNWHRKVTIVDLFRCTGMINIGSFQGVNSYFYSCLLDA